MHNSSLLSFKTQQITKENNAKDCYILFLFFYLLVFSRMMMIICIEIWSTLKFIIVSGSVGSTQTKIFDERYNK